MSSTTDCTLGCVTECDSLADGDKRRLRKDGENCECKDGWGGINCNGMSYVFHMAMRIPNTSD
jgi:hypothetical protein